MSVVPQLDRLDSVRIALLGSMSPRSQRTLAAAVADGRIDLPLSRAALRKCDLPLPAGRIQELSALPEDAGAAAVLGEWESRGWSFLTAHDEDFPTLLREIPDPPLHLFVKGSASSLTRPGPRVGVVGSRAATRPGLDVAYTLARDLALADCTVVSGLARGIDGAAHRGSLAAGGTTVAVLGTGLDRPYPHEHAELSEAIARSGALVTEFPPGSVPRPLHFPRRNRILTGLCDALVVVEGSEKSGARSSVDHALDQGREVLAVPRDPIHEGSRLPNRLLAEGAAPVAGARDVLDALEARGLGPSGGDLGDRILSLCRRACSEEGLATALPSAQTGEIQSAIALLEIEGRLRRDRGGRWRKV